MCEYLKAARERAGFQSRELAELVAPFGASTIGRHERGEVEFSPADILLYAEAYNAPELPMQYCRNTCPIGCRKSTALEPRELGSVANRIGVRVRSAAKQADRLAEIAEDDRVDAAERMEFDRILSEIRNLREAVDELEYYAARLQGDKKTQQPVGTRTAAPTAKVSVHSQYRISNLACQR